MFFDPLSVAPTYADAATQSAEISVLTYNVRGLPWPVALHRGQALKRIGQELARLREQGRQPDVVLIQEGFRREMEELVRTSGYPHWVRGPRREGGLAKLTSGGLHVLSDLPIVDVRAAAFTDCAGFDCLANKGAMLVRLAPEGRPFQVDVVNVHFNARKASGAPRSVSSAAHNRQMDELYAFVQSNRDAGQPLLVGGDFNVKKAPERYYYDLVERPYKVVSEVCGAPGAGCGPGAPDAAAEPWLRAQDLQGFASDGAVQVRPLRTETLFSTADPKSSLSDHDGYLVRYRLTWTAASAPAEDPTAGKVRPRFGAWGVKVSWKR